MFSSIICLNSYICISLFVLHSLYTVKYHSPEFSLRLINAVNKLINNVSRYFVFITNVSLRTSNDYHCCTLKQTVARLVIVDEGLKTLLIGFEVNVLLNILGNNWLY